MNRAEHQLLDFHSQVAAVERKIVYLLSGAKEICTENLEEVAGELERLGKRIRTMSARMTADDLKEMIWPRMKK